MGSEMCIRDSYNGSYMLPETILTTVAAVLIYKAAPQLFAAQEQ